MNGAHLHLFVNHFPIIGTIFGFVILIIGLVFKNSTIKSVSLSILIFTSIMGFAAYKSGEKAEDVIENMQELKVKSQILVHEKNAQVFGSLINLVGLLSILALYANIKNKKWTNVFLIVILLITIFSILFATKTGISGGEIRHIEIRDTGSNKIDINEKENEKNQNK